MRPQDGGFVLYLLLRNRLKFSIVYAMLGDTGFQPQEYIIVYFCCIVLGVFLLALKQWVKTKF